MTDSWTVVGAWGPFPAPGGALRGHLLRQTGAGALLVGCGSGVAGRLDYHVGAWGDLAAVLLPDLHPAHTADLHALGSLCLSLAQQKLRRGLLPTYAPMADAAFGALARPGVLDPRGVGPGNESRVGGWHVRWGAAGRGGMPLRLVGAAGQAAFLPAGARLAEQAAFVGGVGLLVVECADPDGEGLPADASATAEAAGRLAAAAGARALLLTHLDPAADAGAVLAAARATFAAAQVALEGRTYNIPPPVTGSASSPA